MKLSQFNLSVPHNESFVLYNSFTNKFLVVDALHNDLIESAKVYGNIDDLLTYNPVLYVDLIDKGFIVSENKDELQAVKDIQAKVDLEDEKLYQLTINPTMNCNFKCWYCYESHIKDSKMDALVMNNVKKHIGSVIDRMPRLKKFHIYWFGGEPLLYFDKVVEPIMTTAKDLFGSRNISFSTQFTTNGLLIKKEMIPKFQSYNIINFQITLDGNRDLHNTVRFVSKSRGSYDEIVENIMMLCRNNFRVILRINYTRKNLKDLEEIARDLAPLEMEYRHKLVITFHKVWQEPDMTLGERINELRAFFRDNGFQAVNGDIPNTLRQSCYADRKNHATINYNGEVYKCTARNFSSAAKEGDLKEDGTIAWNEKFHSRMEVKFKNKPCLSCPILPICNGACSQVALENAGKEYCVYDFDEKRKKEVVLDKYLHLMNQMAFA